jgi:hypothetical protein
MNEEFEEASPFSCQHHGTPARMIGAPSWRIEESIDRGHFGFSIFQNSVNLSGPRVPPTRFGHQEGREKGKTMRMAIAEDGLGSSDSNELEHDNANPST